MQATLFDYPNLDVRAASVFDLDVTRDSADELSSGQGLVVGVKLGRSNK